MDAHFAAIIKGMIESNAWSEDFIQYAIQKFVTEVDNISIARKTAYF